MGLLVSEPVITWWSICVIGIGSVLGITVGISHRNYSIIEFTWTCTICWLCEKTEEKYFEVKAGAE